MTIAPGAPIEADDIINLNYRRECIVTATASQSIASGGVGSAIIFTAEERDNAIMWSSGTNVTITGPPGTYDFSGSMIFAANTTGVRAVNVQKNGAVIAEFKRAASTPAQADPVSVNTTARCVPGDVITLVAFQTSGAPLGVTVSRLAVIQVGTGD